MAPTDKAGAHRSEACARDAEDQRVHRRSVGLTRYVPIRFAPETITKVEALAKSDNTTVSNWIRRVVDERVSELAPPEDGAPVGDELVQRLTQRGITPDAARYWVSKRERWSSVISAVLREQR